MIGVEKSVAAARTARLAELRGTVSDCMRRARQYDRTAAQLRASLDDLDRDDPEAGDAARVWLTQLSHAESCAAEAERYADRARNEIADLRGAS